METERVKLREPNRLNVFVSHLWERDQIYWRLTGILRALLGSALVDHSIPTSAALKLMSCGPQALEEERGLQRAHLAICEERLRLELEHQTEESRELEAMRSWIADGSGAVAAQASLARQERRVADPIANGIGQRQLPSESSTCRTSAGERLERLPMMNMSVLLRQSPRGSRSCEPRRETSSHCGTRFVLVCIACPHWNNIGIRRTTTNMNMKTS